MYGQHIGLILSQSQHIIINFLEYYVEKDSEALSGISGKNVAWLARFIWNLGESKGYLMLSMRYQQGPRFNDPDVSRYMVLCSVKLLLSMQHFFIE